MRIQQLHRFPSARYANFLLLFFSLNSLFGSYVKILRRYDALETLKTFTREYSFHGFAVFRCTYSCYCRYDYNNYFVLITIIITVAVVSVPVSIARLPNYNNTMYVT